MEDLRRYLRTGDGRDIPPLPDAVLETGPGDDPAGTARLALIRWYRYLHLPGVRGLQEYRAALGLADRLTDLPPDLPPFPSTLRARVADRPPPRRGRRWFTRRAAPAPAASEEEGGLGVARIDQLLFLMARFREAEDFKAFDTVLELQIRWLKDDATTPREKAAMLSDRAALMLDLAELGAHRSWLEDGEHSAALAVEATVRRPGRDDPHLANRLLLKARCADRLRDQTLDPTAVSRALDDLRRAVEAAAREEPPHLHPARELVGLLRRQARDTGSEATLLEALEAAHALVRATGDDDRRMEEHRIWQAELEEQAVARVGRAEVRAVLDGRAPPASAGEAVPGLDAAWRTADDPEAPAGERRRAALTLVDAVPGGHEGRPAALLLAAEAEFRHWAEGGDEASPAQARRWALRAVDAASAGHRLAGPALVTLAQSTVHLAYGSPDRVDLAEKALGAARKARRALPDDDPGTPRHLESLAGVVVAAANALSDATLLPEALGMRRQALALTPEDAPFRPYRMSNLAGALTDFARQNGDAEAAEEGIELARQAADALAEDHPRKHELLLNLATHLVQDGQDEERVPERLAEAEQLYRRGLALMGADHPDRPRFLSSISQVRHLTYQHTGDREALADAVRLAREALADSPRHDPHRIARTILLARPCTALHALTDPASPEAQALRVEALELWETVALDPDSEGRRLLEAQEQRAALAQSSGDSLLALRVLESLIEEEIPRMAGRSLSGSVRKGTAAIAPGLAVRAARAAVDSGAPERAVELLEKGRAILYGQSLAVRRHREAIRRVEPQAARRLEEIEAKLGEADLFANVTAIESRVSDEDECGRVVEVSHSRSDPRPGWAAETRRLAAERERILRQLAEHPEFATLPRTESLSELRARTAGAPVVLVLTHQDRGDALLVPADPARPVEHLPLPGLSEAAVRDHAGQLETSLTDALDMATSLDGREAAQERIHAVLAWLWDELAGPVLERLLGGSAPKRLWWCPVGPVLRLPLHAAGHHRDTDTARGGGPDARTGRATEGAHAENGAEAGPAPRARTVVDRVVPSYTPTLAALAHSLRDTPAPAGSALRRGAFVVTGAESPRLPPLPEAAREAAAVRAVLPASRVVSGEASGLAAVEAALREHALVHFACHGDNDVSRSILRGGGLHLDTGETLTATRLQDIALEHGAVAFLSACSTAEPHRELPDEPMHLAAAFQLAGFRSVVGTLWRAPDTPAMSGAFYRTLTADGTRPPDTTATAQALNTAVREIRDKYLASPTRWAAYLHVGA
ncbi:CHAT domain-containing protein [Streptomyces sp. NPDC058739]|uniref:CHAT domain-containing protein n=1 Tax=Streptomyces sp. NPDC058739 TaxID=3346618 RepID=UPI00367DBB9D